MMATSNVLSLAVICCISYCVLGLPQRRGSCLLLCGELNGVACPSGYSCQSNGCGSECFNTTFVQPAGCEPFVCDHRCPLGYWRDVNGCQFCRCDYSALQTHTITG